MSRATSFVPPSLSLLAAVALSAALALGLPGPQAQAEPPAPPAPPVAGGPAGNPPAATEAAQSLARASRALGATSVEQSAETGPESPTESPRVEATLALRDLFMARPALDERESLAADDLLARPTDGARDPYGDGYDSPDTRSCSKHICVHWVRSGADAPPDDAWAEKTRTVMEQVWRHHTGVLGYRTPATDRSRGGNAKFDVYLKEIGARGLYGYCAPERRVAGKPHQASGFCVLDNDFAASQFGRAPLESLRVTAAHEFFHAIQFAYDYTEDQWLLESSATWVEERFADEVNDNRSYLQFGQASRSTTPLDLFDAAGLAHYGNWVFWEFLSERFGNSVVRSVIQRAGTGGGLPDDYSTQALRKVLASRGGLPRLYAAFAAANTRPERSYEEGAAFPGVSPITTVSLSKGTPRTSVETRLNHLTAKTVRLRPSSLKATSWRLAVTVSAARAASPAMSVIVVRDDGSVVRRTLALDKRGKARVTLPFSSRSVTSVGVTLANASTRYRCGGDTGFACAGRPLDQREQFRLTAKAVRG